jgi:hypothetical protein
LTGVAAGRAASSHGAAQAVAHLFRSGLRNRDQICFLV